MVRSGPTIHSRDVSIPRSRGTFVHAMGRLLVQEKQDSARREIGLYGYALFLDRIYLRLHAANMQLARRKNLDFIHQFPRALHTLTFRFRPL
jgi:hypothetical protein